MKLSRERGDIKRSVPRRRWRRGIFLFDGGPPWNFQVKSAPASSDIYHPIGAARDSGHKFKRKGRKKNEERPGFGIAVIRISSMKKELTFDERKEPKKLGAARGSLIPQNIILL